MKCVEEFKRIRKLKGKAVIQWVWCGKPNTTIINGNSYCAIHAKKATTKRIGGEK